MNDENMLQADKNDNKNFFKNEKSLEPKIV